ncbi:MAG TPA: four helix bundle protein [Candidatus Binatia bacterium]|jgi:four helix bundle protein
MNNNEVSHKITRFEDLIAWQKARSLTKKIYEVTRRGRFRSDYGLSGQIQRAAVSIMSNVAEGFERGGLGEFHQFLSTAKASCAELRSQLYVACDIGYLEEVKFATLLQQAEEVGRVVGGLRASVARQRTTKLQRH